jgi:predicted dehydrogenase
MCNAAMRSRCLSRRKLLAQSLLALGGVWQSSARANSQATNQRLSLALIGVGGRGIDNLAGVAGENIAALCDVDSRYLGEASSRYPKAKALRDWRKLLDADDPKLDAVIIATPDHTHALIALAALRRGLHVYCEKPLAHNLLETQLLARAAAKSKLATQMGNQHHASAGYRRAVQVMRSGVLGAVSEVHCWTVRPLWPQGIERPVETPETPKTLEWDLWLGPAPSRPYHPAYHPRNWRGWWDFGGGALGDFVPHIFDPVFEGLQLSAPTSVSAESSPVTKETAPLSSVVRFDFPARGDQPAVTMTWHDGGKHPAAEVTGLARLPANGALVLGAHGKLFIPELGKMPTAIANNPDETLALPEPLLPPEQTHWQEWIMACKTGGPASSGFEYAAELTDVALIGNIALRAGRKIDWDPHNRRVTNVEEANQFLAREYRRGWELP